MAKDGMQFANNLASKAQSVLVPGNVAIQNKIQDTVQDDLRGISSFKEAFAEARRRGLKQFSWGKGSYTTELAKPTSKQVTKKPLEKKNAAPIDKKEESVNTVNLPEVTVVGKKPVSSRPTPLQPEDDGSLNPLIPLGIITATTAGAMYGANKYVNYKTNKLKAAREARVQARIDAEAAAEARQPQSSVPKQNKKALEAKARVDSKTAPN